MYAIIEEGGKQYRVSENETVQVEKLPLEASSTFETSRVLLVNDGDKHHIGMPYVEGAKVTGTVLGHGKSKKVKVFKYKPKKAYRRLQGHRQQFTEVKIDKIEIG